MNIIILLQVFLILIAVTVIKLKDNLTSVIFFSVFSLIAALLYYFYHAPDLALAEAAIGSAIIPLIFIISISKQREFIVVAENIEDDFIDIENKKGKGYELLKTLTDFYDLKLVFLEDKQNISFDIFRVRNVDVFVYQKGEDYIFKANPASIISHRLEEICDEYEHVKIELVEEDAVYD